MDNIWLIIIAAAVLAVAAFVVPLLIELRKTMGALRHTIETKLDPALDELQKNLGHLNSITGNVEKMTEDVKVFSGAVGDIGRTVGAVNAVVSGAGASTAVKLLSLRTGVAAAIGFILTNLLRKGDTK